jgi:hypothetical protein
MVMAEDLESDDQQKRWREKFTRRKGDLRLTDHDRMTCEEKRADALKNGFVMDDAPCDVLIV